MKKRLLAALLLLCLCLALTGCGSSSGTSSGEPTSLSFSGAASIDDLKKLDGKPVTIVGYMATLSPVSGKYIYLMNMPYQSCPFCVPNTTQLANTMAVYASEGKTFDYTNQAIRVTGVMKIGDYTDEFGYVYGYRIVDASYQVVDLSTVSEEYALWQSIASDGIVAEVNAMFDYLYFLCQWPNYTASYTDENGETITFYLYPGDVEQYLADDGLYGYADKCNDSYFPGLLKRIRSIDPAQLEDLAAIVSNSEKLAADALAELNNNNYTYDEEADRFTLTNDDELVNRWNEQWILFSQWLAKWEL